ncbi:choline-sulfatase [Botrytis cinerea]
MAPDLNTVPSSPRVDKKAAFPFNQTNSMPSGSKPNILYIMADQLAAPLLKMHNPKSQIQTPHLDGLAKDAVVFDSAYCPSPLCAPSRMSMVTGQLPCRIGSYDNASSIDPSTPTYAHYLRAAGYETTLAGKMHFIGEQLHGYESRLTSDIYPGDYGWAVNWEDPDKRLEWYHNASSILQAGICVRSNQLDYDEEVMYKSTQFLYDHVRKGPNTRPFCMTVSLTHPHDPYNIQKKFWDLYEGVDIDLPETKIPQEELDAHSKRLLKVCDLWGKEFTDEQIKRARRAYYGAVSYVDDCIGKLLQVLKDCRLDDNTIIVFSGDHGDMLGERGLWYKMSYFESSVRVPLLVHYPKYFNAHHVSENVSTLDILPTLADLANVELWPGLPMDEYCGEGTISPMMMIRRGSWKYITCPADPDQLYNLADDPKEVKPPKFLKDFQAEAAAKWDFEKITNDVLLSQRQRRLVWSALKIGKFTSWDHNPNDDGREKYIRSHIPLDDLELRARYPPVDSQGRDLAGVGMGGSGAGGMGSVVYDQAGAHGQ